MERLDRIVRELEKLIRDADDIIDAFVACRSPDKERIIFPYAGSTLDRVKALKHVKQELTK